jgi:signal recognition particle subunit SEC65
MFMDEVEVKEVVGEIATPEPSPQVEATESAPVANDKEENLRALRMGKKEAERRAQELERQLKLQQEMLGQLMAQRPQEVQALPVDELDSVPDEDYIPKGQVKKLLKKEREEGRKIAQEEARKVLQEQEQAQFLTKLKSKFTDFDDVVNPETLEILETQDPELAKTIAELNDPYKMGLQSYKYIKSMGIASKVPETRRGNEVEKKIAANEKTVPSPMAYDKRPMAQTFQLTEKNKQDLYNEMIKYAHMAG